MSSPTLPPPLWVDTSAALKKLAGELARQKQIAVDTESNGLHAYRERVCLIQFSTKQRDYLVDPLALADLSPLAAIFANPGIEKVFHAAEYDLIGLKRDFGFSAANIFDTMQAARILGYRGVGLNAMLSEKLGIWLDKRYQKANWAMRPLPPEMLSYARLDTHYLLELRACLQSELERCGRWELAQEEFVRQACGNGNDKAETPAWQRIAGAQQLTGRQLAILRELCAWRERQAERLERPIFKVLDDRRLMAVAAAAPENIEALEKAGLTPRQIRSYGKDLLRAVQRGQQAEPLRWPQPARPHMTFLCRLDALSSWRKWAARRMGIESDIILPKCWMQAIAERNPGTLDELASCMPDSPWRLEHFGPDILRVLNRLRE